MEVLALFPRAPALDAIHAHGHCIVGDVDHGAVWGVPEPTFELTPGAVSSLKVAADLGR